jgi:hypothetical protein
MTESEIQRGIMDMLLVHPKVIISWVTTTGTVKRRGSFIRMGYPGISDIVGMLKDGRFFAIEVKTPSGVATEAQHDFLNTVALCGGVSGIARSVNEAMEILM